MNGYDEYPDWTAAERRALRSLSRALKNLPRTVCLYSTDGEINACKQGVSSFDICEGLPGYIYCGAVLTDLHDNCPERMEREL